MPYSNGLESELGFPFVCLCLALLIVLMISVVLDPYIHRRQRKTMLVIIVLALSLVLQNYLEWRLVLHPAGRQVIRMRLAASVYGYVVRPFLLLLFLYLVDPEHRHPAAWFLALFNLMVYGSAFFCRFSFWIDSANHYHRGPLSFTCAYVSAALLLKLLQVTVRNYRPENRGEI